MTKQQWDEWNFRWLLLGHGKVATIHVNIMLIHVPEDELDFQKLQKHCKRDQCITDQRFDILSLSNNFTS